MKTSSPSWIASAVLYQINLRSLAAREPRNAIEAATEKPLAESPLAYLTRHLPRLRRLGVNTLYLLPPYPIGRFARKGIGSPYASSDFTAVDPEYGTRAEIIGFIRRAHELRFKVLFDITPNHTARDHVWMTEHPEYYVMAPDGSAFYDCDWSDTAKLDYTQPALRLAMIEVYDYWLSVLGPGDDGRPDGIDGFRLDMAHFINDNSFWDQALPVLRARHPGRDLLFMAECYGFQNNLGLFARGMDAAYDDDFYKLGQYAYAVDETGASRLRLSEDAHHNHDFHPVLDAWQDGGIAAAAGRILMQYEEAAPRFAGPRYAARYTDNHDEGRGLYRFGPGAFRALNLLAFLSPRALPFLLTGQESGAVNRPSIHARCQPCDKGRRLLAADGREFRQEGVEFEGNLFARGFEERRHWREFFRDLTALRRKHRPLVDGACTLTDPGEDAPPHERTVVAFDRTLGRRLIRCAVNLGDQPRRLERAPHLFAGPVLYGELGPDGVLPPFSAVVVQVS
jgi:glycosidase